MFRIPDIFVVQTVPGSYRTGHDFVKPEKAEQEIWDDRESGFFGARGRGIEKIGYCLPVSTTMSPT
ncbi:MAG: hypothetical protein GY737_03665 [Desulfobacteraceae bacterium]|nr:hypothetical protein [Desulfobacteraceae bacterium]